MKKLTRHKFAFVITLVALLLLACATGYLIYNVLLLKDIENVLRLVFVIFLGFILLLLTFLGVRFLGRYKKAKLVVVILFMLVLAFGEGFVGYNISKVYGSLKKVSTPLEYTTYSSSIITLKDNDASSLGDIKQSEKLGVLADETSIEGAIIPSEVLKKKNLSNKTESYDSYISAIDALKSGEINYIFVPTNYTIMFGSMEGYEDLGTTTKVIYTQTKKVKKEKVTSQSTKSITEPFTILLMGVDSETEGIGNSAFNGDSLMVITFNPTTLSSTMLSIPRDSYVPIACFNNQRKNKITHAAWKGEECMQKTIENLLDVSIDYYVKINFKGVVSLVDTLGGVKIDVPYSLCEQNSNRQWGSNTVYIEKGVQNLNGEQALAYSRNRHPNPSMCSSKWTNYTSDDFVRGQHQQEVVRALLNKFKSINSLDTVYKLLDTISNNMQTNMSTEQIMSLYNVFKDVAAKGTHGDDMADLLGIQRLYLNGYGTRIYDYGGTNLSLYNYVLYDDSVKAVSDAMKVNLGKKKEKVVKKFAFDVNTPYEEEVVGKNKTSKTSLTLLPSFVGKSLSYVNSFCGANGIKVNVNGSGNGTVISQSVPALANVEDVSSITVTLSSGTSSSNSSSSSKTSDKTVTIDDKKEDNKTNDENPDDKAKKAQEECESKSGVWSNGKCEIKLPEDGASTSTE